MRNFQIKVEPNIDIVLWVHPKTWKCVLLLKYRMRRVPSTRTSFYSKCIIEEVKLIPRVFLHSTDRKRQTFFQPNTLNRIQKKKFPQKRKWYNGIDRPQWFYAIIEKVVLLLKHGQFEDTFLVHLGEFRNDEIADKIGKHTDGSDRNTWSAFKRCCAWLDSNTCASFGSHVYTYTQAQGPSLGWSLETRT